MLVSRPPTSDPARGQGEALLFEQVCQCFEALTHPTTDRARRPKLVGKLWEKYGKGRHGLFPLMRLMLPHLDTERANCRAKHKVLAKMYVALLAVPENSDTARMLINWKKPAESLRRNEQGNFAEVVHAAIKDRCQLQRGKLTVGELNAHLDAFAEADSYENKLRVLTQVYQGTTATEQRWILRIITKDMHIGMKEDSIFKLLHPDAQELYNSVCNLRVRPCLALELGDLCTAPPLPTLMDACVKCAGNL